MLLALHRQATRSHRPSMAMPLAAALYRASGLVLWREAAIHHRIAPNQIGDGELLALAAAETLAVSAASPAYAGPRTYPGPGGYLYWSGYVDAPVGEPVGPCYWRTERFWDGYAWRVRRVRICD